MSPEQLNGLINRLREHPKITEQVKRFLDEVENRGGVPGAEDQAKDFLGNGLRCLGETALTCWAR